MPHEWVEGRRASLARILEGAPEAWQAWARRQVELDATSDAPIEVGPLDAARDAEERTALGQFFTPRPIAEALVALPDAMGARVLDPACGAGDLLIAVAERRSAAGATTAEALSGLIGWDIDPHAVFAARAALVEWALRHASGPVPDDLHIDQADGLKTQTSVDLVIANPPYLEAKRMRRAAPGLRERVKAQFPELRGAWDLYLAFLVRALQLCDEVCMVLPNKVCQSRYAAWFRSSIEHDGVHLASLVDGSRIVPRPFPGTGVYPALLHLRRGPASPVRVGHASTLADLVPTRRAELPSASFAEHPWFVPFETWPVLRPLTALPRLGDVARVVSTCSFHKKGLREQFVTPERPDSPHAVPYLGGPSRTRRAEVRAWEVSWDGWWLDFDATRLKSLGNPLPPTGNFRRPKLVFRQHARRFHAALDPEGRFATKDTLPIMWPEAAGLDLFTLAAIVNSTVFTALYNTVYQGIVVGGETYHYLPVFVRSIPIPAAETWPSIAAMEGSSWLEVDQRVAAAYGLSEADRQSLIRVHLTRVKAAVPGEDFAR